MKSVRICQTVITATKEIFEGRRVTVIRAYHDQEINYHMARLSESVYDFIDLDNILLNNYSGFDLDIRPSDRDELYDFDFKYSEFLYLLSGPMAIRLEIQVGKYRNLPAEVQTLITDKLTDPIDVINATVIFAVTRVKLDDAVNRFKHMVKFIGTVNLIGDAYYKITDRDRSYYDLDVAGERLFRFRKGYANGHLYRLGVGLDRNPSDTTSDWYWETTEESILRRVIEPFGDHRVRKD